MRISHENKIPLFSCEEIDRLLKEPPFDSQSFSLQSLSSSHCLGSWKCYLKSRILYKNKAWPSFYFTMMLFFCLVMLFSYWLSSFLVGYACDLALHCVISMFYSDIAIALHMLLHYYFHVVLLFLHCCSSFVGVVNRYLLA
jgi:hypothetical protein